MKHTTDQSVPDHGMITHTFDCPNLEQLTMVVEACITLQVPFTTHLLTYDGDGGQFPRFRVFVYETRAKNNVQ